ncbi:MAG: ABC transporter ATP-binding protein [Oscillospiraceae bacterium]|nr:ABC transporter ATP-binding protein [Oscillospiraceae bacterium]
MSILEIQNLTKRYGKARGVEALSMTVEPGEILGFIGPNGAGKSTTIRCVMNLLHKNEGEILFEGTPLRQNDTAAYAKIGYLPSEIRLYDTLTGEQMLRYNASFYEGGAMEKAHALAERLQFDPAKKLSALSLGNGKKLGVILCLMHSPTLVVMDEATSGLDPLVQESVYEIIREERAAGTSFLFSSHNLSEVKKLCDRVAILREGRLLRLAPMKELTERNAVRVRLESEDAPDPSLGFTREGGGYTALYTGDMNHLVAALGGLRLHRLTIEEPELEEIFLHYYE